MENSSILGSGGKSSLSHCLRLCRGDKWDVKIGAMWWGEEKWSFKDIDGESRQNFSLETGIDV